MPNNHRKDVRINDKLNDLIEERAKAEGKTDSDVMRDAADYYFGVNSPPVQRGQPTKNPALDKSKLHADQVPFIPMNVHDHVFRAKLHQYMTARYTQFWNEDATFAYFYRFPDLDDMMHQIHRAFYSGWKFEHPGVDKSRWSQFPEERFRYFNTWWNKPGFLDEPTGEKDKSVAQTRRTIRAVGAELWTEHLYSAVRRAQPEGTPLARITRGVYIAARLDSPTVTWPGPGQA